MDLGIAGRKALVCAASQGLGRACAESLCKEGVDITICARRPDILEKTVKELRGLGRGEVRSVVCDITTVEGQKLLISSCPDPDILINNAGGPPSGDFRNWDYDIWMAALNANMLTPIFLIKSIIDGMMDRNFGRIINITSNAVKAPIDILGLSNGARAGLTGFIAGLARQSVSQNVTINSILPGPFETDRLSKLIAVSAKKTLKTPEELKRQRINENPALRIGDPRELGNLCAYLCSVHAGFITGQNIVIDGGAYPGTL